MTQNSEKIIRYLRSDATPLSDDNIQDIINARNSMKRASEAMAIKYKISTRRVYQIWRENHPPIDPREVMSQSNIGGDNTINKTDMSMKTRSINHITHSVETPIMGPGEKIIADPSVKHRRPIGFNEPRLSYKDSVLYLLEPGELEFGKRRITDMNWSTKVYRIKESLIQKNQP
ncbi:10735_t:CDS:2 [Entrophospora sp. SA101]|nr:10735_t:CDS:2 [Entrophospora sp. SA101]